MWGAKLTQRLRVAETSVLQKKRHPKDSLNKSLTLSDLKKRDVLKIA
jgi:hypothetical protein